MNPGEAPVEGGVPKVSAASQPVPQRTDIAWIIIVASGVVAGLQIWKLALALLLIQQQLGFSLLFAGSLLGVVQVAGKLGGLAVSLLSEVISQRRTLLFGLLLLVLGSALGGASQDAYVLLATRCRRKLESEHFRNPKTEQLKAV